MREEMFKSERLIGTRNSDIISNVIINIIKNSINQPSLNMDEEVFADLRDLIAENNELIYLNEDRVEPYDESIKPLMKKLYSRFLYDLENNNTDSPIFRHYIDNPALSPKYRNSKGNLCVDFDDIVTDCIASMTDDYFVDVCAELHIDDEAFKKIKYHSYFDI